MDKPLIIEMNEAKMEIASAVNNALQGHKLPCYLIEPMLSELLAQIREGAKNELKMAEEQMKSSVEDKE